MLAAAAVFGMVLAGVLDLDPPGWATPVAAAAPAAAAVGGTSSLPSFADLAEQVLPAVVSIDAQTIERGHPPIRRGSPNPFDFFNPGTPFRERDDDSPQEFRSDAGGSGFVISPDGYIITNNHVIDGATKIEVGLEGRTYPAELKGADPATDLALLKVDLEGLTFLPLGDSEHLRVGDYVMAVGNPLALDHTVTVGVVSAKGRSIGLSSDPSFENFIQTDAAINRGNSGGPLVNLRGEVIGIATAMNWGAENIGFAVPVDTLKSVLPQLRETGSVTRGFLGIQIRAVDYETAQAFGLDRAMGALVQSVNAASPAEKAGLRHGDIVLKVDDREIGETRDLIEYVSSKRPGSKVRLRVLRGGERIDVDVTLGERDGAASSEEAETEGDQGGIEWLGVDYEELTPQARRNLGIPESATGVLIRQVAPSSPVYDTGVQPGDVVVEVNGAAVDSPAALEREVGRHESGSYLRFYVKRFNPRTGSDVGFFSIVRVP